MRNYGKGIFLGYISLAIHYIANFMLVPLMMAGFGTSEYGVYKIVTTFSAYFMIADGGLSSTTVKYITEYKVENDTSKRKNFCLIVLGYYTIISVLLLGFGILLIHFIPYIYSKSLGTTEIALVQKIIFPLILTCCVKLYTSLFRGYIKAFEKFDISKWGEIFQNVLRFLLIYIALFMGKGALEVIILDLLISAFLLVFYFIYCLKQLDFGIDVKGITVKQIKNIFGYSGAILVEVIAYQIFWSVDNIILGIMTSSVIVAIYSVAVTINSYFQAISNVTNEFLMPSVVKAVKEEKSDAEIMTSMITYGRYKLMFVALMFVGLATLGKNFISLWVGAGYEEAYTLLLVLIIPQLFAQSLDYAANLMWACGKQKARAVIMVFVATANILGTILAVKYWGMQGAAVATALSVFVGQCLVSTVYYQISLKLDMVNFYASIFKRNWLCILVGLIIGYGIGKIPANSWLVFVIQIVIVTGVYVIMIWTIGFNKEDRAIVKNKIKKNLVIDRNRRV